MSSSRLSTSAVEAIRSWRKAKIALPTAKQMRERFGISSNTLSRTARGLIYKARRG